MGVCVASDPKQSKRDKLPSPLHDGWPQLKELEQFERLHLLPSWGMPQDRLLVGSLDADAAARRLAETKKHHVESGGGRKAAGDLASHLPPSNF